MNASALTTVAESESSRIAAGSERKVWVTARQAARAGALIVCALCALAECAFSIPFHRRKNQLRAHALWLHRWCGVTMRLLGLRLTTSGAIPSSGLLVANHLSYLDIIALSALQPCVFVAKSEVARWPLFGWLARAAGTIFVERARRRDCVRAVEAMRTALRNNLLVVLFPEGTSSNGASVLPFKSALLEAAVQLRQPITPARIGYSLAEGSVADEVCYWRDMTLAPHLWNLLRKREIAGAIRFLKSRPPGEDRKLVGRELQAILGATSAACCERR